MNSETTNTAEGWLAIVTTPIGNMRDITLRALDTLKEADLIASEDTRRTQKLCHQYEIEGRLFSYHAHNEHHKTGQLLQAVKDGQKVAVVSDAGTPCVSDPGYLLMREALQKGIEPLVLPGVSALTYAITAGGMPVDRFLFAGFPPFKRGKRQNFLKDLTEKTTTCFLFESPHRIHKLLEDVCAICGEQTPVVLIREATKVHEERLRGSACDLLKISESRKQWKGEFVVILNLRD